MKKLILVVLFTIAISLFRVSVVKAAGDYPPGALLAREGVKDATVYIIGGDGKKHPFPDAKTYYTWYQNFDDVVKVSVGALDQYPDGELVPYRAGVKLVTHSDTTRVYAVSPNGVLHWLPTPQVAESLYGVNWRNLVQDIIPGYFALSYKIEADLGLKYPDGALLQNGNNLYYVHNDSLRLFANHNAFAANNFYDSSLVQVANISGYALTNTITGKEAGLSLFNTDWAF